MSPLNQTLSQLRGIYSGEEFDVTDADQNPMLQFGKWIGEAISSSCDEPNAFTLSTINQNRPKSRVVLFKGFHDGRLVFYTNYLSHKGLEIKENPFAAMNFLWLPLQRQVRIEGKISKVSEALSDEYFKSRPRGSQLGGVASPQSQLVKDRHSLEVLFQNTEEQFKDMENIPRPSHWGGYALEPDYFEFWQGRENRMHDRIAYTLKNSSWVKSRLSP